MVLPCLLYLECQSCVIIKLTSVLCMVPLIIPSLTRSKVGGFKWSIFFIFLKLNCFALLLL